jgi:hypothetical protein
MTTEIPTYAFNIKTYDKLIPDEKLGSGEQYTLPWFSDSCWVEENNAE